MNRYDQLLAKLDWIEENSSEHGINEECGEFLYQNEETIRHALQTMSKLTEARKKATAGEWYKVGLPWNNSSPYIIAGHHDPHVGEAIIDVMEKDTFTETDTMTCEELEHEWECFQHSNCDFITLAANLTRED